MWQIMWAALEGEFDEAERMADALRLRLEVAGHSQVGSIHLMQSFVVRWFRGRLAEAGPTVDAQLAHQPESVTWWALGAWAAAQSRRRSENSTVPGPTSTTLSAGTSARRAASTIASGEGAS